MHDEALTDSVRPAVEWRKLATYEDPTRANLVAEYLQSQDIDILLGHEQTIGLNWLYSQLLGGVPLFVPADQEARAQELLKSLEAPPTENPPEFAGGHVGELQLENTRRRKRAKALVTLFLGGMGAVLLRMIGGPDPEPPDSDSDGDA